MALHRWPFGTGLGGDRSRAGHPWRPDKHDRCRRCRRLSQTARSHRVATDQFSSAADSRARFPGQATPLLSVSESTAKSARAAPHVAPDRAVGDDALSIPSRVRDDPSEMRTAIEGPSRATTRLASQVQLEGNGSSRLRMTSPRPVLHGDLRTGYSRRDLVPPWHHPVQGGSF